MCGCPCPEWRLPDLQGSEPTAVTMRTYDELLERRRLLRFFGLCGSGRPAYKCLATMRTEHYKRMGVTVAFLGGGSHKTPGQLSKKTCLHLKQSRSHHRYRWRERISAQEHVSVTRWMLVLTESGVDDRSLRSEVVDACRLFFRGLLRECDTGSKVHR